MKNKKNKMYDLVNVKEWEVRWAAFTTLVIFVVFIYIDFYKEFSVYESDLKNLMTCILGAFIGLLGFSLSGIAIIVSLFSTKETNAINKINGKDKIIDILTSYSFLAKNIGIQCFLLVVIYFLVSSRHPIMNNVAFYVCLIVEIYHIAFVIYYTIALVKNCVELYRIKEIYSDIENAEKSIHDTVNEVKIDYIFSTLIENYGCSRDEIIEKLILFIKESQLENKEKIVKYIQQQYEE